MYICKCTRVLVLWLYNSEAPVLVISEVWNTPSLALLPGPLSPGVVIPVRVSSMGQKDLFKNYSYLIGLSTFKKFLKNIKKVNMNIHNSLTSIHKITLYSVTCNSKSINQVSRDYQETVCTIPGLSFQWMDCTLIPFIVMTTDDCIFKKVFAALSAFLFPWIPMWKFTKLFA